MAPPIAPAPRIEQVAECIILLRGQKVILDADLAALYGVSTKRFNEQVRRNAGRFPGDFMFQLTDQELRASLGWSPLSTACVHRAWRDHGGDSSE